jgi:hypothetical protein
MIEGSTDDTDATDENGSETASLVKKTRNYDIAAS